MTAAHVLGPGEFHAHERFDARIGQPRRRSLGVRVGRRRLRVGRDARRHLPRGDRFAGAWRGPSTGKAARGRGGLWHHGFGPDGLYRPRGAFPGGAHREASAAENPVDEAAIPRATVFAASVFGDRPAALARMPPAVSAIGRREVRGLRRFRRGHARRDAACPDVTLVLPVEGTPGLPGRIRRRPAARDDAASRLRRHGRLLALA